MDRIDAEWMRELTAEAERAEMQEAILENYEWELLLDRI